MSKAKRLEVDHKGLPFLDDKGVYVLYEDYAVLQKQLAQRDAQIAALASENVSLKASVEHAGECISAAEFEGLSDALESKDGEKLAELIHRRLCHVHLPVETPATDAAANALRAEGVKVAISQAFMDGIPVNRMQFIARMTAFANQLCEGK